MKYGYIRADRELSDDYVSLDTVEYSKIDMKYIPVFENSEKNTIRICRRKNKVLLTAASPKSHTEGHPFPFSGNDRKRYTLIRNFSDRLQKGDTVMFSSILDLSENEAEAVSIYHLFWNKGIYVKFIDTPWLDTQMYDALSQQVPEMIFPLIDTQIGVTFRRLALSHDRSQNTEVSQLNQEYKKKLTLEMIYSYSREFAGNLTEEETRKLVMDKTGISRSTYYRRLKELQIQKRQKP